MSNYNLRPLDKTLRNKLENAVKKAREVAEDAARAACEQLGVARAKPDDHLTEDERDLRRRLRIHGRQLGDERHAEKKTQSVDRLVEEIAYEHWHRMLFARFLAENGLLMYPDPDDPVAVSIEDCNDLAADEGASNGWELASRFASKMLPQIFRLDSPVFSLSLPPEKQQQLEKLLADLDDEVFAASDSLGWVYQFWQADAKKQINESEVKIGARELPAVTQLFTEPYMVSFLLDNSLGAWWAARRLTEEDLRTADSEQELRDKASLPGVPLEYLRFVRTNQQPDSHLPPPDSQLSPWTPAAGAFDAWPAALSELKTLDPCCGSGHFLVATLLMLAPMRMELEGLSATEAVDRVLSENLHGLEIDKRCVELAAFALALAAWRFPDAGGYRVLPDLNVACCGLSVSASKDEWKALAKDDTQLRIALDWMYDEFKDAPVLGSLLNPATNMAAKVVKWDELAPAMEEALKAESSDESKEAVVIAHGLSKAALLLSSRYSLVCTNVPYLSLGKQDKRLAEHCEKNYAAAKPDLATVFLQRILMFCDDGGICSVVIPQNWLFLKRYADFRKLLLTRYTWNTVARLGAKGFSTPMWDFNVQLFSIQRLPPEINEQPLIRTDSLSRIIGIDVSEEVTPTDKAGLLRSQSLSCVQQEGQLSNPNHAIVFAEKSDAPPLEDQSSALAGCYAGDRSRFVRSLWECPRDSRNVWELHQTTPSSHTLFDGREEIILWEEEKGVMHEFAESVKHLNHAAQNWRRGKPNWGKRGVVISLMADLPATIYTGERYASKCTAIVPNMQSSESVEALWAFCESGTLVKEVRKVNQKLAVEVKTILQVPFDLAHWQQVAAEKYPLGLPEPYSDDPTQWIFHGHPASSTHALQVATARLLGYRWPAELDREMELATDARAWIERTSKLNDLTDDDGIVCIPAVGSEQPTVDRLLNFLHHSYEEGRAQEQVFRDKLDAADENDPLTVDLWRRDWQPSLSDSFPAWRDSLLEAAGHTGKTLESWLRDKFFTQHCKLFHNRPFIWHIWDGLKDGFSVLVNYHKLDNKTLKTLVFSYMNDWIRQQRSSSADGHEEKLAAALRLKALLEKILLGESPHDIFVRWKPIEEQPIGWNPDLNDGVRLNIRPWMMVGDIKKKGAGVLRDKPGSLHWKKDRGKDVESAPWYHLGPEYGGKVADRINDHHLTLADKKSARGEG